MKLAAISVLTVAILAASCSSTHKPATASQAPTSPSTPLALPGTEWLLADLNGTPPLPKVQATLSFLEAGGSPATVPVIASRVLSPFRGIHSKSDRLPPRAWLA